MVMSLATIQNVLLCTTVVCMHCSLYFFFSALLVVVIWYLVFPIILVRAYLTFPKAVVLILKQATSLRLSMLPGPALIQADLDYQRVGVDKKIQRHIVASTDSAWQDRDFIMAIEMVCLFLCLFRPDEAFISNFRCDKCLCIRGIAFGTGILTDDAVMLLQR